MDCINWENFRNKAERISCVVYFEDEEFNEETYKETVRKMEFSIITKAIEENKKRFILHDKEIEINNGRHDGQMDLKLSYCITRMKD